MNGSSTIVAKICKPNNQVNNKELVFYLCPQLIINANSFAGGKYSRTKVN